MTPTPPILFIIFNRPDQTKRVFEAIRAARPAKLFIAADGPRPSRPDDARLCAAAREAVKNVDWPCEVVARFQDANQGCRLHVSGAITWFFEQVEEGVILEDDCLPSPSFFSFCAEMLERYREDEEVMHVNGTDFLPFAPVDLARTNYHFSRCPHVWGWATWRRAWDRYDLDMRGLDAFERSPRAQSLFLRRSDLAFWARLFKHIRDKRVDTWDAQWTYSIMSNGGLVVAPHANMVENIGFGPDATHTFSRDPHSRSVTGMPGPYRGPSGIAADAALDLALMKKTYNPPLWRKLLKRLQ